MTDLLPHEAEADMLTAFAEDLVQLRSIDEPLVRDRIAEGEMGFEQAMDRFRASRLGDCLSFLRPWFNRDEPADRSTFAEDDLQLDEDENLDTGQLTRAQSVDTIRRKQAKVGRNDPCPCGSGRKYKKCCARN